MLNNAFNLVQLLFANGFFHSKEEKQITKYSENGLKSVLKTCSLLCVKV